jgi:hypothetical protein
VGYSFFVATSVLAGFATREKEHVNVFMQIDIKLCINLSRAQQITSATSDQSGPGSYQCTGSRIRHLNPYPANPTTSPTTEKHSRHNRRWARSKVTDKGFVSKEICRNFTHKAFGVFWRSEDKELSVLSGIYGTPERAGTYQWR